MVVQLTANPFGSKTVTYPPSLTQVSLHFSPFS
jgi:hypothetical protein